MDLNGNKDYPENNENKEHFEKQTSYYSLPESLKASDFYGDDFTPFNADLTGVSADGRAREDYHDPEKFGYLKLRQNKEKQYRTTIYKLGGILCVNLITMKLLSFLISYLLVLFGFGPGVSPNVIYLMNWVFNAILVYAVPILIIFLFLRYETLPESFEKHHEFKRRHIIPTFFAAYFAMISGSFITEFISAVIYEMFGVGQTVDVFESVTPENIFQTVVFYVSTILIAPIAEEIICRKMLFQPLRRFGDYSAVFITALFFGFFHGNMTQFLYAFLSGIIFGFAVIWSGSVITSIILHMLLNAFEIFRSEIYTLAAAGAFPFTEQAVSITLYLVIIIGALSLIGMTVKGMFRLKNTCPEISNRDKTAIVLVNPVFILALSLMIIDMFL